jgi:hypothetical protein
MRNVQINFQQSSGKCKVDDCCEEEEDDLREFLVVLFLFILPPHTKDLRKNKVSISGFSLLFSKKKIQIHPNQMWFLRLLIWIDLICNFIFGLVRIRSPLYFTHILLG